MKTTTILSAAFLLGAATAQDIGNGDFPGQCSDVCQPVVSQSNTCDQQNNDDDDDNAELDCLCNGQGMSQSIPACDACVQPYRVQGDDEYSDIQELLNQCGFAAVSLTSTPPVSTQVYTTTSVDDDGDTETETITSVVGGLPTNVSAITSVYTTTSTDDDGDIETDVETTTRYYSSGSVSSTVVTTTNGMGSTVTSTQRSTPTAGGAAGGNNNNADASSSASSDNFAAAQVTAAPLLGAGVVIALGAIAAL